jgi:hypothetical protein
MSSAPSLAALMKIGIPDFNEAFEHLSFDQASEPLDCHPLKPPGMSFPLHLWFLSRKLCPSPCANSRVHFILLSYKGCDGYFLAATSSSNFATVLFSQLKTVAWSLYGSFSALSDSRKLA